MEKKEEVGGVASNKIRWKNHEFRVMMISHWLSCDIFLLAGLVVGPGEILSPAGVLRCPSSG